MGSPPRPTPPSARSPAPAPQWVALRRLPGVSHIDPEGTEFRLALDARPRLAHLAVSPLVATGSGAPGRSAFVLAADPSGRSAFVLAADPSGVLLLSSSHGPLTTAAEPGASTSYFLCDAVSNAVRRLPDRPANGTGTGTADLIVSPGPGGSGGGGGHSDFMVAELVPSTAGDGSAVLHCFSPEPGVWIQKILRFPDRIRLPWYSLHVLSYMGKLWWIDLSQGLLACDRPGEPALHFVPLPASVRLAKGDKQRDVSKHRCLNLSGGKLRFVMITAHACVPKIKLWTLADPEAIEWTLDHEARLEDIWDDQSYTNSGLPKKRPVLALVHPATRALCTSSSNSTSSAWTCGRRRSQSVHHKSVREMRRRLLALFLLGSSRSR